MEELFYPRLSLAVNSAASRARLAEGTAFSKALQALVWTVPTILSLVLLFYVLSLSIEFRQMQRSLDTCSTILGSGWETEAIPETTTITSTILTSGHAKWWFGDATTTDAPASMTHGFMDDRSQAHANNAPSTHAPLTHLPKPTEHAPEPQVQSLMPVSSLPFPWPIPLDLVVDAKASLRAVLRGLGTVWRVCVKLYHYPLDPP